MCIFFFVFFPQKVDVMEQVTQEIKNGKLKMKSSLKKEEGYLIFFFVFPQKVDVVEQVTQEIKIGNLKINLL